MKSNLKPGQKVMSRFWRYDNPKDQGKCGGIYSGSWRQMYWDGPGMWREKLHEDQSLTPFQEQCSRLNAEALALVERQKRKAA